MSDLTRRLSRYRLALLLSISVGLAGCQPPATETTSSEPIPLPFQGKQVALAIPSGTGLQELWQAPLQEWTTQTGGDARLNEYDADSLPDLSRAVSTGDAAIVAIVSTRLLPEAAVTLELSPLPESALSAESGVAWGDQMQGVRDRIGAPRRKPLMVPLSAPMLVLYYRADLLAKAGLQPPQTWDDYSTLLAQLPKWAPGLTAVEPWSESFRATMFLARGVPHARHPDNYSVFVDLETLAPLINNPAFRRAAERARADLPLLAPDTWSLGPLDCRRQILEGRAALAIGYEPAGGASRPDTGGISAPRSEGAIIGVYPLPGVREIFNSARGEWDSGGQRGGRLFRATLTAFDGHVACSFRKTGVATAEAAWNAFAAVAGPDFSSRFPPGFAGLTRESQLSNPGSYLGTDLSSAEANEYLAVVADSLRESNLVFELPFPQRDEFRSSLAGPLTTALRGNSDPGAALQEVSDAWTALIETIGRDPFRRAYRQILGLGAKPDAGK